MSARAVVLATGGIGNAYEASTNPAAVTGDGIALALRAGAELVDMEFVQFHPTALYHRRDRSGPAAAGDRRPCAARAPCCSTHAGRPIMAGRHPLADLAPRDIVAREIDAVDAPRRTVDSRLARRHRDRRRPLCATRFPTVLAACARIGIDATSEPIPVAPAEHFLCGGVRTDRWGATDVPGLYAVGEVAATGVHGANRLASNSLLEGLVFGRRVAARLVLDLPAPPHRRRCRPDRARSTGRGGAGSRGAEPPRRRPPRRCRSGPGERSELDGLGDGPLATVARAVVAAAEARHESRGCHWRADYPHTSEQWAAPRRRAPR